jgi:phosphoribosylaminoimidazole-succinocarboxamide synthase
METKLTKYQGKVRDVYSVGHKIVMVATDRISCFDVILPRTIPHKGQVLNQIAAHFLNATRSVVPNWLKYCPDPCVSVGENCTPFKVEMVIRGYMVGHAWREYNKGKMMLCGVELPEDMNRYEKFPTPIITPTTKADQGQHDEDISATEIVEQGLVSWGDYAVLQRYTYDLFRKGQEMAAERGLILVDTKFEFGKTHKGDIVVIDEILTPDSSRYFLKDDYEQAMKEGRAPKQLSKEFVRQWLLDQGFDGQGSATPPEMSDDFVASVSQRYVDLYETITGKTFVTADSDTRTLDAVLSCVSHSETVVLDGCV